MQDMSGVHREYDRVFFMAREQINRLQKGADQSFAKEPTVDQESITCTVKYQLKLISSIQNTFTCIARYQHTLCHACIICIMAG